MFLIQEHVLEYFSPSVYASFAFLNKNVLQSEYWFIMLLFKCWWLIQLFYTIQIFVNWIPILGIQLFLLL